MLQQAQSTLKKLEFSLEKISKATGLSLKGNTNCIFTSLLTDSRSYISGRQSLFVALKTSRNDGHLFIDNLYEKGARCFLISEDTFPTDKYPEAGFILAENTLTALQKLAAYKRSFFQIPVTAITGSNGKTVVKEWLYQLMNDDLRICRSPKSYNSQIGVPLSVWNLNETHESALFEAGISQPDEMTALRDIIQPQKGILTNIKAAHDEHFHDKHQKTKEKIKLFEQCEKIFYNADCSYSTEHLQGKHFHKSQKISWGRSEKCDLHILSEEKNTQATTLHGVYKKQKLSIQIPFTDSASVENACHCWLYLLDAGMNNEIIAERMLQLQPVAMRLEMKEAVNGSTLINDSYNSDLESLSIALDFLNRQHQHPKKTVILSDIFESGKSEKDLYTDVARLLSSKKVQRLIGIGPRMKQYAKLFSGEKQFFDSTESFLKNPDTSIFRSEAILLKGARQFEFERISTLLQQKSHDTILEINLGNLVNNLNYFKSKLKQGTGLMAMVKAFSYGSGSYEIASALQYHHVNYLAVAYADEGVQLRQGGISLPIMVMNPEPQSFDALLQYNLEPEIFSFRILDLFTRFVKSNSPEKEPRIHIKLDTGMHRLGFEPHELPFLLDLIQEMKGMKIASVFSHLAASDEPDMRAFTEQQIKLFDDMSSAIAQLLPYKIFRHISNSAGITTFPSAQFDMVRLGIGLYGIGNGAEEQKHLLNVGNLKTSISQIKKIKAGDTVGYSRKGKIEKDTRIATVPIGYADGYNRKLSGGAGKMYINGKACPVVGNVCMDMTMIDLSALKEDEVKEGDEVVVFGSPDHIIEMAKATGTIPYEILTSISGRVKRVYLQE